MTNTLTCVYCGMAYPEGTPPHGSQVLTDHIKACEKHPMRQLELDNGKLRAALTLLVGAETRAELEEIRDALLSFKGIPDSDRAACLIGVQALLETMH